MLTNPSTRIPLDIVVTIVNRASSLYDYLDESITVHKEATFDEIAKTRLDMWCASIGSPQFARRLEWAGFTEEQMLQKFSRNPNNETSDLPRWARLLHIIMNIAADYFSPLTIEPKPDPIAFEDVFIPFLQIAQQQVFQNAESGLRLLTPPVWQLLTRQLLELEFRVAARHTRL